MFEPEHPRAGVLLGGLGLGALTGAALGYLLGPAGSDLRARLIPLLREAAERPEVQHLLAVAAERAGLGR